MNPIDSAISISLPTPLLEAEWLASHLDDPNLRILDATVQVKLFPIPRIKSGRREWKRGHIPGAAFADLLVRDRAVRCFGRSIGRGA